VSLDTRLDKMIPALSGQERAVLVLRDFKAHKPQDHRLGRDMDASNVREYNRLIRLMNTCNMEVLTVVLLLCQRAQKAGLKLGWLATLHMWSEHAGQVERYLKRYVREPITEQAYRDLVSAEPERWAPAAELAEVLTSRKDDWDDDQVEDAEEEVVFAEAWEQENKRNERKLAALVKAGTLDGRRSGGELRVRVGSFYAWLGEEPLPRPEFGFGYEPSSDETAVASARARLDALKLTFTRRPVPDPDGPGGQEFELPLYGAMALGLGKAVVRDVQTTWIELASMNQALAKVAEEFGGEDPVRPETRDDIEEALRSLAEMREQLDYLGYECELPELDQDEVEGCLAFIRHFAEP
jgi:hypothetical protein